MKERVNTKDAREKLLEGVSILSEAVSLTLGPSGNTVVITDGDGSPHVTKDGATVAQAVSDPDPEVNCGIELVRQAAVKTAREAGDGTTTSTVLANAFIHNLKDYDPVEACKALDFVTSMVSELISQKSVKIVRNMDMVEGVATISANNDGTIGRYIREAYEKTGMGVNIMLLEGFDDKTVVSATKGIKFDKGYESIRFVNNQDKGAFEISDCDVVLFENPLCVSQDILQEYRLDKAVPVLIIGPSFSSEVINFGISARRSGYSVCMVQAEGWGDSQREHIRDIAALICPVYSEDISYYGRVDKVIVDSMSTTIIGGKGHPSSYIASLRARAGNSDVEDYKNSLLERASILENGTCSVTVGAKTEAELKEKMDRYDDAVRAVKSAVEEGVLPGGGIALSRISDEIMEKTETAGAGRDALLCLHSVRDKLCEMCGISWSYDVNQDFFTGYDFRRGKEVNCLEEGILDPAKVERVAVENAASVAKTILSTKCIINTREDRL